MAEDNPAKREQTAVTAYFSSKQFVFARQSECQYSMAEETLAAQRQTAVTAYSLSQQLLLFALCLYYAINIINYLLFKSSVTDVCRCVYIEKKNIVAVAL